MSLQAQTDNPNLEITKADFDEELQEAYRRGQILVSFKYKKGRTKFFNFMTDTAFKGKKRKGVITEQMSINQGNHEIPLVIYKPQNASAPLPIMLYMHGGGYVSGSPEMTPGLEDIIAERPCIIVAPRYRRALEAPYPAALDDCYATLLWVKEHGHEIGGINNNIIIAGHSAGGGLAAAVTLKNRDLQDIDVAFQMPLYPMLDYRNNTASALMCSNTPIWDTKSNKICWGHYLADLQAQNKPIPPYASPALNDDYRNFPPTISFVGGLEPFKDEVMTYIDNLNEAGVPTQFQLFPKAFHGFESVVPDAKISMTAHQFLLTAYAVYYDKYCPTN